MLRKLLSGIAVALVAFSAVTAFAGGITPALQISWSPDGSNWSNWQAGAPGTMDVTQSPTNPNVYFYTGEHTANAWDGEWGGSFDVDPAVNHAFAITNNTPVTQTFVSILTVPTIGAISPPSIIECGVSVSVSAAGFPGTLSAPAGDSIFEAQVSGASVGPICELLNDPFSLTTGPLGQNNASGPHNVGPAPGPGLGVVDSIGIRYAFTLTPGASATLNGNFIITPEPSTLALLALGGLALVRRRR